LTCWVLYSSPAIIHKRQTTVISALKIPPHSLQRFKKSRKVRDRWHPDMEARIRKKTYIQMKWFSGDAKYKA
jgi:hypothetical protein